MATSNVHFGAQVDAWVQETQQRMNAVFREATQRVVSRAQERIPVDTGFARASIRGSLRAMPTINAGAVGQKGTTYPYNGAEITLTIAGAEIGQTIYIGWTAAYAQFLEWGHSKQAPNGFVGLAAMEWPQIVAQVTEEARARASA